MINKTICSLQSNHASEYVIEKSRFICQLQTLADPQLAAAQIAAISRQHPKANHNCYAYIVGADANFQKFSDDGEPGGTAGMPILNILKHENLSNILAVVTRYFGGIKLGTGGLARAYAQAVKQALETAEIVIKSERVLISFTCDYSELDKIKHILLQQYQAQIQEIGYDRQITLRCYLNQSNLSHWQLTLNQLKGQAVQIHNHGLYYV